MALDFSIDSLLIIILAVLNDAATLGIAYDRTSISPLPDKWRVGQLFTMSTMISLYLVGTSWAFFFVARGPLGLGMTDGRLGTAMWLQLSTVEHFLIFSTRLPGWLWEIKPSAIFLVTVLVTLVIPFFMSVFGVPTVTPAIGWAWSFGITWVFSGDEESKAEQRSNPPSSPSFLPQRILPGPHTRRRCYQGLHV